MTETPEPQILSYNDIAASAENCDWLPGPPKWSNPEAKALYDELNRRAQEISHEFQRKLILELEPLNKQMADLYSKFATPTLYPVLKP